MKKLIFLTFILFFLQPIGMTNAQSTKSFKKVILWGHKKYTSTHSYIHYAFDKAFKHLGYETYWFDNSDNVSNFDFSNSLFITEGNTDQQMPLRDDCRYILHNCDDPRYKPYKQSGRAIILQVYTHDCLPRKVQKMEPFIYYDLHEKVIYMPWATDLLPHEIDAIKSQLPTIKKDTAAYFIGTMGGGVHGNIEKLDTFATACRRSGVQFKQMNCTIEENISIISKAYMAPSIQGKWQCDNGYIPCRIFKNISYGQMGITNNKTVSELFEGKIVYNEDCRMLFHDAKNRLKTMTLDEMYSLMDFVKEKHTYLNRIEHLFRFLDLAFVQ